MSDPQDLRAVAHSIIDANRFMTLATADGDGVPLGVTCLVRAV